MDPEFVAAVARVAHGEKINVARFCHEHGVSRDTFYKYVTRFRAEGASGFTRRSTAPHHRPSTLGAAVAEAVLRARKELAGPGINLLLPFGIDRPRVIDVRTRAIQIQPQEIITRDNISISVDAVVYATIASPRHAVLEVEDYMPATLQLAATTLRAVLGKMEMDDILVHRDAINTEVRTILDTRTEQWGVEISAVEIKDIQLPKEMQRAMARQAEAERERRAKVIAAEGEVQATERLAQAAAMIANHPGALQLRLYQTLVEVSGEASSTIVFPVPIDLGSGMGTGAGAGAMQAAMQAAVALAAQGGVRGQLPEARPEARNLGSAAGQSADSAVDDLLAPRR